MTTDVWGGGGAGTGAASAANTVRRQEFTATAGQTLFTLTGFAYLQGLNYLEVFINGVLQRLTLDYVETSQVSFTLVEGAMAGDNVTAVVMIPVLSGSTTDPALRSDLASGAVGLGGDLVHFSPYKNIASTTVEAAIKEEIDDLGASSGSTLVGFIQAGTGATLRTVQDKLRETVSVRDFGAVGDGVTDDTAAFNAAIAYANSRGGIDFLNIVGTTIEIPDGRYVIGALSPITRSGCEFVGSSRNGAVLLLTAGVPIFTFGDGVNIVVGGGASRVKLEYLGAAPSVPSVIFTFDLAYRLSFSDILVANIGTLCKLGISSSRPAGGISLNNIDGSKANTAAALFAVNFGAGLFLSQVHVFVPVPVPVHPGSLTTVANCSVFNCLVGFWDTIQATNCIFERFDVGVAITAAAGMVYQNMYFSNVIMDYFRRYAVYAESQVGGVVAGIRFDNTSWFVSWDTAAISLTGAGYNDNHEFMGKVVAAGGAGVNYALAGAKNVTFNGMQINSVNRLGGVNGAIVFAANSKGFTVVGCKGNVDTTAIGFPWRAPYGVSVAADCDSYLITGNVFDGSVGGYAAAANAVGSSNRKIFNNLSANYAGYIAKAVPATTVRYTNTTPFVEEWTFFGGTITGGYDKNLHGLPGALQYVHFRLQPGDTYAVGYSVSPTANTFVEP